MASTVLSASDPVVGPRARRFPTPSIWLIVGAAALIRIVWIYLSPSVPVSDWADYFNLAARLADGSGYVNDVGPTAFRPVGFPLFVSLGFSVLGTSLKVAQWMNVLASVAAVYFTYRTAAMVWGERHARWAAAIIAITPSLILFTAVLASETLVLAAVTGGVHFLLLSWNHDRRWAEPVAGFCFAVAALASPAFLVMPALFVLVPGRPAMQRVRILAVVGIAMAVTILPWTVRNYRQFDELIPISTNGGFNFAMSFSDTADGKYRGDVTEVALGFEYDYGTNRLVGSDQTEYEIDRALYRAGLEDIRDHPERVPLLAPRKLLATFGDDVAGVSYNFVDGESSGQRLAASLARLVAQGFYMVLMLAAVAAVVRRFRAPRPETNTIWMLAVPVGFTIVVHSVFIGSDRFHLPILAFVAMMAAESIVGLVDRFLPGLEPADRLG